MAGLEDTKDLGPPTGDSPADAERRRAMVRMGQFAGLTAPAVVTLLTADASEVWAQRIPGVRPRPVRPVKPRPPVRPKPPRGA